MGKYDTMEFPRFVRFIGQMDESGNQKAIVNLKGKEFDVTVHRDWAGKWVCKLGQDTYRMSIRKVNDEKDKPKP